MSNDSLLLCKHANLTGATKAFSPFFVKCVYIGTPY